MDNQISEQMEHREHAEHAAHSGDPLLLWVSATIAILAVVAASVGSLETIESGTAISKKSESVLLQNRATDQWSYFQAQSIKKNMYDIAKAVDAGDPARAEAFEAKARGYEKEGEGTRARAEELGRESEALLGDGEHHEKRHHVLTAGVTLLHVGIAVATLSIIMRGRRWPWYGSMALGVLGTAVAGYAYLV